MIRFGLLVLLVAVALWIYTIFDSITADETKVRTLQKPLWVIIVLVLFPFGSIAWIVWGKPRSAPSGGSGGGWGGGRGRGPSGPSTFGPPPGRGRKPPIAPDDDPDFLRSL